MRREQQVTSQENENNDTNVKDAQWRRKEMNELRNTILDKKQNFFVCAAEL